MATVNSNTGSASLTSTISVSQIIINGIHVGYNRSSNTAYGTISLSASVPAGASVTGATLYWTVSGYTASGAAYINGQRVYAGAGSMAMGAVSGASISVSYKADAVSGDLDSTPTSNTNLAVSFTGVYLAVTYNEAYTPPSGGSGTPPPPPSGSGTGATACTPPTNIQINDSTVAPGGGAVISWTMGSPGAGNPIYSTAIWRASSADMSGGVELYQVLSPTAAVQVYAPSTAGQTYYYRLITVGTVVGYNSGFSSEYIALTAYVTPVTSPNVVTANDTSPLYIEGGNVHVAWSGAANGENNPITSYNVYRNGAYIYNTELREFYDEFAPGPGGSYTYKIHAIGTYESATYFSPNVQVYAYSAPSVSNLKAAGSSVNITVINGASITLTWSAANGAYNPIESYTVQRSDNGGAWTNIATNLTAASLTTNAHANAGSNSRFRVIAIGQRSNSAYTYSPYVYTYPASTGSLDKTSVPMDGASQITLLVTPGNAAYTHKATWSIGSKSWADTMAAGDTTSVLTVPANWCEERPNNTTGTANAKLETYSSGVKVGEANYTFTVTVPASVVPSLTSITATRVANGVPAAITRYVQSHSKVTLTINGAAGVYNSTIASVAITGGGFSASASPSTFGPLPTAGTITFTGTVTDSRGRKASKTVAIAVQAYTKPSLLNASMFRSDEYGTEDSAGGYVRFYAKSVFSSIDGQNSAALEGRVYMKGASPSAYTAMTSETAWIGGGGTLLAYKSYMANIRITDLLYDYTFTVEIPTETILLHGLDGVAGAAIGKYCENEDMFEIPETWGTNIPVNNHDASKITTGTLPVARGGTGVTTIAEIGLLAYPVGSIYMSVVSTSPATLFGGTWTAWGAGRVPVGLDAGQTEFDTVEETGGAKTHTLTEAEMPIHNHSVGLRDNGVIGQWGQALDGMNGTDGTMNTGSAGSGTAHNNLQPYIVCYMWKRTA